MAAKIRILVVDDEALARDGIVGLLASDPETEVIGTCADGQSALAAIRSLRPDLVFLDIQMPRRDGFEVLAELKPEERPTVVFVTAFDKYAVRAFEQCALDYLLKPFTDARFVAALGRAKAEIREGGVRSIRRKLEEVLVQVQGLMKSDILQPERVPVTLTAPEAVDRVVLKTGSDLHFIAPSDIIWVEAQADFVKVHTSGASQLVRETLQSFEQRVDAAKFLRIHRSSLVNLDHVKKVTPALYGDYTVLMSDGAKLRLSRKNRGRLKQLIARLSSSGEIV
jgi:two-component system LytT family response regulator